jgi:hypothetical protein
LSRIIGQIAKAFMAVATSTSASALVQDFVLS